MKVFLIIVGAFLTLLGAGCTAGGIGTLVVVGSDGWIQSGVDQVDVQGAALVSGTEEIEGESPGDDIPGDVRIRIRAQMADDAPVFIGVARASDATDYLQGAPLDVVDDLELDPTEVETNFVPGNRDLEPPAEQDFWLESVSGTGRQELDWEVESGEFRFVVAPVEPTEGFAVNVSAGVRIPWAGALGWFLIVSGVILLLLGVLLIVLMARRIGRDSTPSQPSATPAPPDRPPAPSPPAPEAAPPIEEVSGRPPPPDND